MLSQYRFGIERGGSTAETPLSSLVADGQLADDLQVRILADAGDVSEMCAEGMLSRAMDALENDYAVVGTSEDFDDFLAVMIAMSGWPDVIYENHQVGQTRLESDVASERRVEAEELNRLDQRLYDAVRARGPVWVNADGHKPSRSANIMVISPNIGPAPGQLLVLRQSDLPAFSRDVQAEG